MSITQKVHGTNAAVHVFQTDNGLDLICQSRSRIITPEDDNYGFARFVHANKQEFCEKLGCGLHFGEWAGLGINSGEGLSEKVFVLFDYWKFPEDRPLPVGCRVVPVLYQGPIDLNAVENAMADLKIYGSQLSPGFMRPEGVVVNIAGVRYKKVFDEEETKWSRGDEKARKIKNDESEKIHTEYGHLFQPLRLEKLLSRDERYLTLFPKSLPDIVDKYFGDLVEESQVEGDIAMIKDKIRGELFKFVKSEIGKEKPC